MFRSTWVVQKKQFGKNEALELKVGFGKPLHTWLWPPDARPVSETLA